MSEGNGNYERIVQKIARASGLEREEIERRVEAKRAKLSGLISREGAAQVIAAELGINFDNEKLKLDELLPGMRKVNTSGKVLRIFPVREFKTKKGDMSKVCNFILADDTSNTKVVLWDTNHIDLIENGKVVEGVCVEIVNGSVRDNEIHLGSFSEFKLNNDEKFENVVEGKIFREKTLKDLKNSESATVRAFIVQAFDPKTFVVCPECKRKVLVDANGANCAEHGKVIPEKRALMSIVLDDGTQNIRAVLFHESLNKLGFNEEKINDPLLMSQQKENALGMEMIFSGTIRNNKFFNNDEFIVDSVEHLDMDKLIAKLEKD